MRTALTAMATSLALVLAGGALAETTGHDAHSGHAGSGLELVLNNGAKWQGDDNMLRGMEAIRDAVQTRAEALHSGTLDAAGRKALAGEIMGQVDFIVGNCKLEPAADEQLHIVLGQVIDGAGALEGEGPADAAAATLVGALDAYGAHFEHPGWTGVH